MKSTICGGTAEANMGIWQSLLNEKEADLGFTYHAKVGFFLDNTNNEAYILSVQGKNSRSKRGENFGKVENKLDIDPRTFLLQELSDFLPEQDYKKIKAIKPEEHPFAIIKHEGYKATYEQTLKKAGFIENKNYLEK